YNEPSPVGCCSDLYIYSLGGRDGLVGAEETASSMALLRWGNYDTVNDATLWVSSDIPTTGIPRINGNAVPSSQNLPNSFFLTSQPATWWATPWGTPRWPPIGPDVTGGNVQGVSGHVYDIPAKLCFTHMANDPAYSVSPAVKLFNAKSCYTG